jgi:hypothetical protein
MFRGTDVMKKEHSTENMGKYLVLRLSFSPVDTDGDMKKSFHKFLNADVNFFSEKYYAANLLESRVEIDPDDALVSLYKLIRLVQLSDRKLYLIVDECDAFVNRMALSIDTSKPDIGLKEYNDVVVDKNSLLRNFGNVIKEGTAGDIITRSFFTGVAPQAFCDGLSSLNMVSDLTFDPHFEGLFGMTSDDVSRGLSMINGLSEEQRVEHQEKMRVMYNGYHFVKTQKHGMFNPQYVLYYLRHLKRLGVPPKSMIDPAVSGTVDNVAKFLIDNHKASSPYTLKNFALGIIGADEMGAFEREVVPALRTADLFNENKVSSSLISLAYYHGYLTYKLNKNQRSVLTSPNMIMQTIYVKTLFDGLPEKTLTQLEDTIRSGAPDLTEFKRILTIGAEEASKELGKNAAAEVFKSIIQSQFPDNV